MTAVAPARYLLGTLHEADPDSPGGGETTGRTRCGTPMLTEELWTAVDVRDGDVLCAGCFPCSPASAGFTQETLI